MLEHLKPQCLVLCGKDAEFSEYRSGEVDGGGGRSDAGIAAAVARRNVIQAPCVSTSVTVTAHTRMRLCSTLQWRFVDLTGLARSARRSPPDSHRRFA